MPSYSPGQIDKIVQHLVGVFSDLMAVYAHGSAIRNATHQGSDLDLALLFPRHVKPDVKLLYRELGKLASLAGRPVDIGVLNQDNTVYAKEVVTHGKRISCRDKEAADEFEMYAFFVLHRAGMVTVEVASAMKSMVGFRNIAIHEYQGLELGIVRYIVEEGKADLIEFCRQLGVLIKTR